MSGIAIVVLLLGAPAFTAGLIAGITLADMKTRSRALAACAAAGSAAGLAAAVVVTAGQALLWITAGSPALVVVLAWNALVGTVGTATGYGYGWKLANKRAPDRRHGAWLVAVTATSAAGFLLVVWIAASLNPDSAAMAAATREPAGYVPPKHTNAPDYTVTAACRRRLDHPPTGRRLPDCQWFVLDGDVAWVQDQAQQVFEWGDTCGLVMDATGSVAVANRIRTAHCLDPALPALERSARALAGHLDRIIPSRPGPCRSAVSALEPWPQTILADAAVLRRATRDGDAPTIKAYLEKLDGDLAPGVLGFGRAETRCRLV